MRRGSSAFQVLIAVLFGVILAEIPSARAQVSCGLDTRVPFAGHTFPLEGALIEETLDFENAFPSWSGGGLDQPTYMTFPPDGTNRLFIVERSGIVRSISNRPDVSATDLRIVLDIQSSVDSSFTEEGMLGLAFHPSFAENGLFFVHYTAAPSGCSASARCARIDRYQIDPQDPNRALPGSVFNVLEIERPGSAEHHNGGMIAFGPEGYLFISVGDQDFRSLAQETDSLRGKILRIDIDEGAEGNPGIPDSNPFGNAVWSFGLRNPWRFSFDRENPGDLWIADVGSGNREEVNWVPSGTAGGLNFGWPDCEGTLPLTSTGCDASQRSPDLEYPTGVGGRTAVIGGFVYRGPLASLNGQYLFADFSGAVLTWDRTTRNPQTGLGVIEERLTPVSFIGSLAEDESGEVYTWDYFRTPILSRFVGSSPTAGEPFPQNLSDTGLFNDVAALSPAPGLIEYGVASPLWSDGADKQRWIALPGTEKIEFRSGSPWGFPIGTAIVKHFELEQPGEAPRRLETRVMLRQTDQWVGLTYRWNTQGTDATLLLDDFREDIPLAGGGTQTWLYPSPSECLECHSAAAGRALGVRTEQLNGEFDYASVTDNQLHAWNCIELFDTDIGDPMGFDHFVALDEESASLAARVRSHLSSNCSICHQPGTGVTDMDLRHQPLIGDMNIVSRDPIRGDLGLPSPKLVDPGNHGNSIVSVRMESAEETSRMAKGTLLRDFIATSAVADWIDDVLFDSGSGTAQIDSDEDGVIDEEDNCPGVPNSNQANVDGDSLGDPCDPDQQPDLWVEADLPAVAGIGQTLGLAAEVSNVGVLSARPSQVRFRLSLDTEIDDKDASVGDCMVAAIDGDNTAGCFDSAGRVPDDLVGGPGDYFWIACADSLERIDEGDETNNCEATVVRIPEPGLVGSVPVALLTIAGVVAWKRRKPRVGAGRSI